MRPPSDESPVNPLPPPVAALFIVIVGIEVMFTLGARGLVGGPAAVGWRLEAIQSYGFFAPIFDWMWSTGRWPSEHLVRFFSFGFIHGNFTHALFAGVMLLAMGKMVAEALGNLAMVAIFVVAGVGGAAVFGALAEGRAVLIGAFPQIYGLIGAFTYLLWVKLGAMGAAQIRAFTLIGVLIFIQLVFGLLFGGGPEWIADLAGFAFGFSLAIALMPGGVARIIARMRRD